MNSMITASPSIPLEIRADSLLSLRSLGSKTLSTHTAKCTANDGSCEKPVNENALTIGLAVGIPVFIVILVLGYFLIYSYRRDKKEMMEHDPDFDETGEATALPDLPQKKFEADDPFSNRHSIRYPGAGGFNHNNKIGFASSQHLMSLVLLAQLQGNNDKCMDAVVLPYHHETGSKALLDEYARSLGTYHPFGADDPVSNSQSRTLTMLNNGHGHSRNPSNMTYFTSNNVIAATDAEKRMYHTEHHDSTKQENLVRPVSGVVMNRNEPLEKSASAAIPNELLTTLDFYDVKELHSNNSDLELVTNLSRHSSVDLTHTGDINGGGHKLHNVGNLTDETKYDRDFESDDEKIDVKSSFEINRESKDFHSAANLIGHSSESITHVPDVSNVVSPVKSDKSKRMSLQSHTESDSIPAPDIDNSTTISPFEESSGTNINIRKDEPPQHLLIPEEGSDGVKGIRVSPRMSAFNLLKNDSDEEEDFEKLDENNEQIMTSDQQEDLNRMKSVYKVYFDRENSVKLTNKDSQAQERFEYDSLQPLPQYAHEQFLKINNHLKGDTDYSNKRMTTTLSIYTENPTEDRYQYQQYQVQPLPQQPVYYSEPIQEMPAELPPLQSLPPPSDIRKLTIQTYTDFEPLNKAQGRVPFVPIENEGVWNLSTIPQSPRFGQNQNAISSIPSASQLARSSVVMLNPVTEITKQRKFKPAGSIDPRYPVHQQPFHPHNQHFQSQQFSNLQTELIPEGKDDVRRMMNGN